MNIISTLALLCMIPSFACIGSDMSSLTKQQYAFSRGKSQWELLGAKMEGLANIHAVSLNETREDAAKPDSATQWLKDNAADIDAFFKKISSETAPSAPTKTNCCWKAVMCCCCPCSKKGDDL